MRAYYSTVVDKPVDDVWNVVRDFNGLATWYSSAVSQSHIEDSGSGTQVGSVRAFTMGDGNFRERLLAFDDVAHSYSYTFCEPAPFPVTDYLATIRVTEIVDGHRSFVEWFVEFESDPAERNKWSSFFSQEVFAPALEGLKQFMS